MIFVKTRLPPNRFEETAIRRNGSFLTDHPGNYSVILNAPYNRGFMILVFRHLFYKNYVGLTFWPFIILKDRSLIHDSVLMNHEKIHLKQQLELMILPFYLLYLLEWIGRSLYYFDMYEGYRNISFEREAFANERDLGYPDQRRSFGFLGYFFSKKRV